MGCCLCKPVYALDAAVVVCQAKADVIQAPCEGQGRPMLSDATSSSCCPSAPTCTVVHGIFDITSSPDPHDPPATVAAGELSAGVKQAQQKKQKNKKNKKKNSRNKLTFAEVMAAMDKDDKKEARKAKVQARAAAQAPALGAGWAARKLFPVDKRVHTEPVCDAIARVEAARSDPSDLDRNTRQPSFAGLNVHNFKLGGGPQPTAEDGVSQIVFHVNAHWRMLVLFSRADKTFMVHDAWQSKHETTKHGQRGYQAKRVSKSWRRSPGC
jgi:hypothetical protein